MKTLEEFVKSEDWSSQWAEYEIYLASAFLSADKAEDVLNLFAMLQAARDFKQNIEVICHEQIAGSIETTGRGNAGRKFYGNKPREGGE